MHRSILPFARFISTSLALILLLSAPLSIPPRRAYAGGDGTLFRAEFESAPLGPLTGPLTVETGTVVPQGGSVTVAATPTGRALALNGTGGQATALMQWSNFLGALPISTTEELNLSVSGDFTTALTGTADGSFGLLAGASFFEFFSFGANDALTRGGAPIGRFNRGLPVHMDVRIKLKGAAGEARITLLSASSRTTISVPLAGGFSPATLNQMRFQVPAGGALTTADRLRVRLGAQEDEEPPAVIIIGDGDIEQEVENEGGVIFISIKITIVNTGGRARGVFLVLDLDELDELFDLADIGFLDGIGFVSERDEHHVAIGLGQNNIVDSNGKIKVKIKLKARHGSVSIKVNAHFRLRFGDSGGDHEVELPPVVIIVPVIVVPGPPPTGEITPTAGMTPTDTLVRLPLSAIDVRFKVIWSGQGGLDIFGLPLTGPIARSDGMIVQYFERARFEFHPELRGTRYEVLLGLLAVELGRAAPPTTAPTATADLQWYFPATGHTIARPFRSFWRTRGGLALFGLPIGEPVSENGLLVQYFERERMELHPELAGTPYEVELGHLGVDALLAANR
ncbi:MAG TPA: hypothetical protein VF909_02010 [Roseiflexaceae bacterium]